MRILNPSLSILVKTLLFTDFVFFINYYHQLSSQTKQLTMKKIILSALTLFLICTSVVAKARIPLCFPCEYIETTIDLPAETEFYGENENPLNVGYRYKQVNILWIPIWNYEGEYCFVNDSEDTYYDLTEEEKTYLTENHDAKFDGSPLSIWNKAGGKVILGGIFFFILWGYLPSKNKDNETKA